MSREAGLSLRRASWITWRTWGRGFTHGVCWTRAVADSSQTGQHSYNREKREETILSGKPSPLFTVFHKFTSDGGGTPPLPLALGSENALTNACVHKLITGFGHKLDESNVEMISKNGPAWENL